MRAPPAAPNGPPRSRRLRALVRLGRKALSGNFWTRSGRISAWYVAITHCALLVWVDSTGPFADLSGIVARALSLIAMSAGLVALGSAVDPSTIEDCGAADALARSRGATDLELEVARALSAVAATLRAALLPALAVSTLALSLSDTFAAGIAAALRIPAVVLFVAFVGVTLGLLARWAAWLSPQSPKAMFLALLFAPHVARLSFGEVPSVIAWISGVLDRIDAIGGGIG